MNIDELPVRRRRVHDSAGRRQGRRFGFSRSELHAFYASAGRL
ncbi:MAG: hypothetical protein ABI047_18360 [Jatrophihabitantaceae bacterium]